MDAFDYNNDYDIKERIENTNKKIKKCYEKFEKRDKFEEKYKKIRRKIKLLEEKYINVDLDEKEIIAYKKAGCNTREDVIKLEVLYIKNYLEKSQSKFDFDVIETINKLNMIEKSIEEEPLSAERYKLIKRYLVITEITYDLDVSLISVIDDLYNEYVEKKEDSNDNEYDYKKRLLK